MQTVELFEFSIVPPVLELIARHLGILQGIGFSKGKNRSRGTAPVNSRTPAEFCPVRAPGSPRTRPPHTEVTGGPRFKRGITESMGSAGPLIDWLLPWLDSYLAGQIGAARAAAAGAGGKITHGLSTPSKSSETCHGHSVSSLITAVESQSGQDAAPSSSLIGMS